MHNSSLLFTVNSLYMLHSLLLKFLKILNIPCLSRSCIYKYIFLYVVHSRKTTCDICSVQCGTTCNNTQIYMHKHTNADTDTNTCIHIQNAPSIISIPHTHSLTRRFIYIYPILSIYTRVTQGHFHKQIH